MTVPLVARGSVLGAVSFVTSASGRVLTGADVEMATALASRAALALDNARMFSREQRIALTLQRSLLPQQLPATPTLETAAVYHPAAQDGSVGGDWYDLIALPCGRVGLVMGDVMGRGVQAAALMGQVRAAVRAYAAQDLRPGLVLGYLDDLVRGLGDDTIVTCVYAVYDPIEEALCVANAGHLPPLLVGPGGVVRLDVHGPMLGAGLAAYEQDEVPFGEGTVLALYTDGLVERRSEDLDARTDLLATELGDPGPLEDAVRRVVDRLGSDPADPDDLAVMLVRPRPGARPEVARLDVVPHAARVREIRHFAADTLAAWHAPAEIADQVQLVVTELVTNVIQHASGHEATVRIERHADRFVVVVVDPDSSPPLPGRAEPEDEGGRGLHLVEALAHRWGSRQLPQGGKVVWVELMPAR